MNALVFSSLIIASSVGFFCIGYLWGQKKVLYWRIKWINMEHDLAHLQNRKPRNISDVENTTLEQCYEKTCIPTPVLCGTVWQGKHGICNHECKLEHGHSGPCICGILTAYGPCGDVLSTNEKREASQ